MAKPNNHTGSDGAFELANLWTKRCIAEHEHCRPSTSSAPKDFVPTRLLDVTDNRVKLVESRVNILPGADRTFVALSHCWGLNPIIRTLKENYNEHLQGIPEAKLSQTFRDAVHATRKLGFKYIWIDSLCIKQDDGGDWAREAETMCDVYQSAILTIAAAHASGGEVGCFAQRDGLLLLPFYIEVPVPDPVQTIRIQWSSYGRVAEIGGGDPFLYGRAWVLQEQLLSPRMLIFDGVQMRWECLTMHGSEGSIMSGVSRHGLHYKHIRSGIMENTEYFDRPSTSDIDATFWALMKHQFWCHIIMDYTHRSMTKSKDRLVAIAGIANALRRHTKSEYWAGLWSDFFAIGLLWHIPHNDEKIVASQKGFDLDENKKVRHEKPLAPSWSWASLTVPVAYAQNDTLNYDQICKILGVNVAGGSAIQEGTATIHGHIRYGYVNPIYQYAIREAVADFPHMMAGQSTGRRGLEYRKFKNRLFHFNEYFLFSEKPPAAKLRDKSPHNVSKHGDFRFTRGWFRPDEVLNPNTEITFVAIAQLHAGSQRSSRLDTSDENAALEVVSLALVPTGNKSGEYRRVGVASWQQCSWYGYLCGWKDERDRRISRLGNFSQDGYLQEDTWWDWLARKLWWDDMEALNVCPQGKHSHPYNKDEMLDMKKYCSKGKVEEGTVTIV